jgi:hypothetical protein
VRNTLPANVEAELDNLLATTRTREPILKFVKGKYKVQDDEVALGTEYLAHASQLAFSWIKFVGNEVVDRRQGRAADRFVPPEREELGDLDKSEWERDDRGNPKDPWTLQNLMPFENPETGEVVIFTTSSIGGKIATERLAQEYAKRAKRTGSRALPIIHLECAEMQTKSYGDVKRPHFEIVGWENETPSSPMRACAAREGVVAVARDITPPPRMDEPTFSDAEIETMQADALRHANEDFIPF